MNYDERFKKTWRLLELGPKGRYEEQEGDEAEEDVVRSLVALLASKDERIKAMDRALKDIHAMVRSAHSPRWEAVGDIAKKALASPPSKPAPRQENSDG